MAESAGNYKLFIHTYSASPSKAIQDLISTTKRYYLFDGKKIPILFDYDFAFVSYGEDDKGRPVRKLFMNHAYSIEFEPRGGKIVNTGY